MQVQPYLFLEGRCEEAIEFYRRALGANVLMMMRMKDAPEQPTDGCAGGAAADDKVLHACLRIGASEVMLSDGMCSGRPAFQGIALSLSAADEAEAERLFGALADGGTVQMPLAKTFFSPCFGMLADRFGVAWMVLAQPAA